MRAKGLLISGVTLAGLAALFVLAFAAAVPQDALGMQRPTAVPQPPPPGYEPYSPAAPDAYPDLVVQKIQLDPPNPYVNQAVTVYVTIKNIGAADVEDDNNCFLDFYINPPTDGLRGMHDDHYWDVLGWQMRAGQSASRHSKGIVVLHNLSLLPPIGRHSPTLGLAVDLSLDLFTGIQEMGKDGISLVHRSDRLPVNGQQKRLTWCDAISASSIAQQAHPIAQISLQRLLD